MHYASSRLDMATGIFTDIFICLVCECQMSILDEPDAVPWWSRPREVPTGQQRYLESGNPDLSEVSGNRP